MATTSPNLLFIVNPGSGKNNIDASQEIRTYLKDRDLSYEIFELPEVCNPGMIKDLIQNTKPNKVIAVGGDGTVKLAAEGLVNTTIPLGIIPTGSANGMAKELGIETEFKTAIDIIIRGETKTIHLTRINDELCIHLSDIGFNATVIKKFEDENSRGMWGYFKAAWKVLRRHSKLKVELKMQGESVILDAAMVVVANATRYGNGVVINPEGSLYDDLFEVVIIKKISFREIFKMRFTNKDFNEDKTALYQTKWLRVHSKYHVHFQVDGEYRGKVNTLSAEIVPNALKVIVPSPV